MYSITGSPSSSNSTVTSGEKLFPLWQPDSAQVLPSAMGDPVRSRFNVAAAPEERLDNTMYKKQRAKTK